MTYMPRTLGDNVDVVPLEYARAKRSSVSTRKIIEISACALILVAAAYGCYKIGSQIEELSPDRAAAHIVSASVVP